jgi:hypothetical protein
MCQLPQTLRRLISPQKTAVPLTNADFNLRTERGAGHVFTAQVEIVR